MKRRDFIKALGGGVAAWPLSARAQRTAMPVIGYLAAGSPNSEARLHEAFVKGLGEADYADGKNTRIEYRWAENQYDRLPSMAADLVRQEVAVLAATTTPAARAAKAATSAIPIVFTTIADPVQIGFVASLNRPGGNVTGATMLSVEVSPKLMELLHGAVPFAGTMALLILAFGTLYQWLAFFAGKSGFGMTLTAIVFAVVIPHWAGFYFELPWIASFSPSYHFGRWLFDTQFAPNNLMTSGGRSPALISSPYKPAMVASLLPMVASYAGVLLVIWYSLRLSMRKLERMIDNKLVRMGAIAKN